jgi:hypothetical protein
MSKESVEELLLKGGSDRQFRVKYDNTFTMDKFVEFAMLDGFEFTVDELKAVLKQNGDIFDSNGNPPKKSIWQRY